MKPLWPKEHGAWGMLLLPLAAAAYLSRPIGHTGILALTMVLTGYLCRAPLEQLAAPGKASGRAWVWLLVYLVPTLAAACLLVVSFDHYAWLVPAAVAMPAGGVVLEYNARGEGRQWQPELIGAAVLPVGGVVLHVAVDGLVTPEALRLWLAFALYHIVTVPYVRARVMARRAERAERFEAQAEAARRSELPVLGLALVMAALAAARGFWSWWLLAAWLPTAVRLVAGQLRPLDPELPIRRLGFIELGYATLYAILVTTALVQPG